MSVMPLHLGRRPAASRAVVAPAVPEQGTTLADLGRGHRATIVGIGGLDSDPVTSRRLFDLGFAPGVEVQMLRKAPMADPVVFRVAGYDIALRRVQARCIQVTTDPPR